MNTLQENDKRRQTISERKSLQRRLEDCIQNLHIIEEKVAKYTELEAPVHLMRQREDLQSEIQTLKTRLAEWDRVEAQVPRQEQDRSLLDESDYGEISSAMEAERLSWSDIETRVSPAPFLDDSDYQRIAEAIESEKATIFPEGGGPVMTSPTDQLALMVLAQATQFLFDELGRRLGFWRKKKGEQASPESIEPVSRQDVIAMRLDDLERQIDMQRLLLKKEDIETSMDIIRKEKRKVNALRKQFADPLTPPTAKADIEAGIKGLEDEIAIEGNRLEAALKEVYGEGPE